MATSPVTQGLLFPLQRDGRGDFLTSKNLNELIVAAIKQVLGVRGAGPVTQGELPWRTQFGSQTYRLRHSNNDEALVDIVKYFVLDALAKFETRILLLDTQITQETAPGFGPKSVLRVKVKYRIRSTRPSSQVETVEVTTT